MHMKSLLSLTSLVSTLILAACATQPSEPPPKPVAAPEPAPVVVPPPKPVAPTLTGVQSERLEKALSVKTNSSVLRKIVEEAKPSLSEFLSKNACINDGNGSVLNSLAAPGVSFAVSGYPAPMNALPKHDKQVCLTVSAVQKLTAITLKHLRLEAVYQSDGGESMVVRHELQKQPDGRWLVLR